MSNTSKGKAVKGSKYWMQTVVNDDILRNRLDKQIGEPLRWLSPLADDFMEYELKQPYVYEKLGMSQAECKDAFEFWPNRQPQWDGIAISEDGKTLYLVEAKAHTAEMKSNMSATSETSIDRIEKAMKEVYDSYFPKGVFPKGDFEQWKNGYYQLGNRLTFLKKLQELQLKEIKNVKLVLLNFVNDETYKPTSVVALLFCPQTATFICRKLLSSFAANSLKTNRVALGRSGMFLG